MIHNFNAGPSVPERSVWKCQPCCTKLQWFRFIHSWDRSPHQFISTGNGWSQEPGKRADDVLMMIMKYFFLHGGATITVHAGTHEPAEGKRNSPYTETGTWAGKAIKEANYSVMWRLPVQQKRITILSIPKNLQWSNGCIPSYYYQRNNCRQQWHQLPYDCGVPLVADMSSDILSRTLDFNRFDLIYAGHKKNMGAAGVNLVVVNKNITGRAEKKYSHDTDYRKSY